MLLPQNFFPSLDLFCNPYLYVMPFTMQCVGCRSNLQMERRPSVMHLNDRSGGRQVMVVSAMCGFCGIFYGYDTFRTESGETWHSSLT